MSPAIEFQNVWKGFRRRSSRVLMRSLLKSLILGRETKEEFQALKAISFRIEPGEGVAIVGSNGAGKSTLLSLVAGLVPPDQGTVKVNGRISPLLELGSGFHPDLTGAENVRLNAALLGLSRRRIRDLFDEIIDFSGIENKFIDEPLRTYSTGMVMRLAFSVAINMDPDVLLVDEILAVGDTAFQEKCFQKVHEFRNSGRSLLCVSHAAGMVQQLCDKAIWLDHGEMVMSGAIAEVLEAYNGHGAIAV